MSDYRFSTPAYDTYAPLPVAKESIGRRVEFVDLIRARPSTLFRSAIDSIDAAVALLALGQVSQSLLLFTQAAEVSLKAVLDEVKQMGLAAWAAANPGLMRRLAAQTRLTGPASIKDMTLIAAFREVAEFVDFSENIRSSIDRINRTRNEIAHRGGDREHYHVYLDLVLNSLLPLLDESYQRTLGVELADFLLHDIARELIVAASFLAGRRNDPSSWAMALRPLRSAHHHRWPTDQGIPLDFSSDNRIDDRHYEMRFEWERHIANGLPETLLDDFHMNCHICRERCFISTDGELRGGGLSRHFDIIALACPYCDLCIPAGYSDLATIHYGPIDEALLGADKWAGLLKGFGYER